MLEPACLARLCCLPVLHLSTADGKPVAASGRCSCSQFAVASACSWHAPLHILPPCACAHFGSTPEPARQKMLQACVPGACDPPHPFQPVLQCFQARNGCLAGVEGPLDMLRPCRRCAGEPSMLSRQRCVGSPCSSPDWAGMRMCAGPGQWGTALTASWRGSNLSGLLCRVKVRPALSQDRSHLVPSTMLAQHVQCWVHRIVCWGVHCDAASSTAPLRRASASCAGSCVLAPCNTQRAQAFHTQMAACDAPCLGRGHPSACHLQSWVSAAEGSLCRCRQHPPSQCIDTDSAMGTG
jgi:hypothetical protein